MLWTQFTSRGVAILVSALLALVASNLMLGQAVNGTLLGNVVDSTGAVVNGAKVTITEMKTGVGRGTTTNASGNYELPDLPPGVYEVVIEHPGFKKEMRRNVEVAVNSTVRVNLRLDLGEVSETVAVTGDLPLLQTDRADVGRKMEALQVTELPLGTNRNFQNLLNLVPGTTRAHREHSEFFNSQDSLSTEVNGQSREFNDLKLDGVDDNERTGLLQVYIPPAEAIQTVDVTTGNYSAEFGRAGGAVTNVQLKSGTNQFHGSAYEYNRISALAAVPFFQNTTVVPKGKTVYNYYGGTIGGPIFKNKLFFFGDILRIDDVRGKFDQFTLPTAAFRSGDFSSVLPNIVIYDPYQTTDATHQTLVLDANGNPIPVAAASRTPFPGNMIPASRITSLSQKILGLVPGTNVLNPGTGPNYQAVTNFLKTTTSFDTKFDFNHTDNDRYAFRFSRAVESVSDQPVFGLAGGPKGGGFQGTGVQHTQSGALNQTHVFSPTLISETRIGIDHYRNITHQSDFGSNASDALGIKGVNINPFTSGLTGIDIQGGFSSPMVGYAASQPWDRGETNINGVTNWTKIWGNHTFKWGLDLRRLRDDLVQSQDFSPRGVFRFGTGTTDNGSSKTGSANNLAAFLLDAPTVVGRDLSFQSGSWRETEMFTYAGDTWQVTPRLTVNAGLRWEMYFPPTPHHSGGFSNYDPTTNSLVLAGIGSNPLNLGRTTSYSYFAPRFGVAYRLTEKLVVRGGFGISYEPFTNNQYAWDFPVRQGNAAAALNNHSIPTFDYGRGQEAASMAKGFPSPVTAVIPTNGIIVLPDRRMLPVGPAQLATHSGDNFNIIDKNFRQPYIEAWNFAVQYALPKNFVIDAAYVGNHGVRVPMTIDLNAAVVPGICQYADATSGCAGKLPTDLMKDDCHVRPTCDQFGRTGASNFLFKRTTSNYNALQVKLDHKWSSGFLMTTSYTFSKALAFRSDMGSDGGNPSFYLDTINGVTAQGFHRNYSVTSQDRRHVLTQSFIYDLPFGRGKTFLKSGWASWIAGGWQISAVPTFMTGRPLHFVASGSSLNANGTAQTPIQIAPFHMLGGIGKGHPWFDITAFCPVTLSPAAGSGCPAVPNGTLGNMARYAFAGPKFFNMDASISRRFSFTERIGMELRIDALNSTNTPQFDLPSVDLTNSNYGLVTGTASGNRAVTLAGKITF